MAEGMEQQEIVTRINELRSMQLEGRGAGLNGNLSDDQVREGIRLSVKLRQIRAGSTAQSELPAVLEEKLEDLF